MKGKVSIFFCIYCCCAVVGSDIELCVSEKKALCNGEKKVTTAEGLGGMMLARLREGVRWR
jgi:hypothetical protein